MRRTLVVATAAALVIACSAPVVAQASITVPSVPTPIAAVTMQCGQNGIDVNKATATQLRNLSGVTATIAQNIIASRPYLRPDPDLLQVNGIGPDKLAAIDAQGLACATPTTTPPAYYDVCRAGDGRIDTNRPESLAALTNLFGGPTAQRIVNHIPFWKLATVKAEGNSGAGVGKVTDKLLPKLCLTPPTINYSGTRYGWIDPARGGYVDLSDGNGSSYRLTVPGGIVSSTPGAWASVTPTNVDSALTPGAPAADFHINGSWSGEVYVGLPPDQVPGADQGGWSDTLWHKDDSGDWNLTYGDANVTRINGRVTGPVTSLSPYAAVLQPDSMIAPSTPSQQLSGFKKAAAWAEETVRRLLGVGAATPSCLPNISDGPYLDGAFFSTAGDYLQPFPLTVPLLHCIEYSHGSNVATWRFAFNRGGAFWVHDADPAPGTKVTYINPVSDDFLSDFAIDGYNYLAKHNNLDYIVDNRDFAVELDDAASPSALQVENNLAASMLLFGLQTASDAPQVKALKPLYDELQTCGYKLSTLIADGASGSSLDGQDMVVEVVDAVKSFGECVIAGVTSDSGKALLHQLGFDNVSSIAKTMSNALLALKFATAAMIASDQTALRLLDGTVTLTFDGPPPSPPANADQPSSGDLGGPVTSPTQLPPNVLLKMAGSNASFYLDANRVAHPIPDGGTYICLTQFMATRFEFTQDEWAATVQSTGDNAVCSGNSAYGLSPRGLIGHNDQQPKYPSEGTAPGTLLRSHTADFSGWYYVRSDGYKVRVLDQNVSCLLSHTYVYDYVTDTEFFRFPNDPSEVASTYCGT